MDLKLRCPKCESSQTRARIKTNDRICNTCGNIYLIKEDSDIKKEEEKNDN